MYLNNKKILLIIAGGISAYKTLDLIRLLRKSDVQIKTILTKSGKKFVTPLSVTSLTGQKPYESIFNINNEAEIDHISLSRWADIVLVVPTTANFMSKLISGKADDLATTVLLASNKDVFLIPAMNVRMWLHKATQRNLKELLDIGYKFIGPTSGEMACGEYGEGKMSSPRQIFSFLNNYFKNKNLVKKKKISALVTTGPTREYIDPVRYISNESSGKQGYEIALALSKLGIKTTLISGPTNINFSKEIEVRKVISANDMMNEVKEMLPVDIAVCAAAVSDFRPKNISNSKIKKQTNELNNLKLKNNIDILDYLGKNNKNRPKMVVGFSAETENLIKNSLLKLKNKYCDLIVANDVSKKHTGLSVDYNKVSIIQKNGKIENIPRNKKSYIASLIAKKILDKFLVDDKNIN
ncbi:bifunctional phosphopantothenoylcysteine decarboxylase/phosphopantothenate--cysteine ligase CoaBC [Pelagibacteraceae bacterium]|nr:bifunctional phosphopantothenoylcysteine decarboxylase/phosphopantothenate--cysteine ligase CoaBC [Pelagibacteraceae bacterium]|tara:strand:- start:408 stop:1637 length:1230 start_codon:yes stop_codon:yes gene_type:complete